MNQIFASALVLVISKELLPMPVIATGFGSLSGGTGASVPIIIARIGAPLQACVCAPAAVPHTSSAAHIQP
ncbi:MAG: hypothetical protein NVSMB62_29450 [Acidobacteriaceae bacterium]